MNNEMVMLEDEFNNISSSLSNDSINASNAGESITRDFSGAVNVGLLGDSAGIISNQIKSISKSINNVKNIMDQHSKELFDFERGLANKINDLEIPEDFIRNDSSSINSYTNVLLSKMDGKSVNDGSNISKIDDIDDSKVDKEQLKDITNGETYEESYDENSEINNQVNIANINENNTLEEKNYDDSSDIKEEVSLSNMDTSNELNNITYNDNSMINPNIKLTEMNENDSKKEDLKDYDSLIKEQSIYNIDKE